MGTEDIASSLKLVIIGTIIIPTTIPGLIELNSPKPGIILLKIGVTKVKAKKPNTIVGIPANISRIGLMIRRVLSLAYSLR